MIYRIFSVINHEKQKSFIGCDVGDIESAEYYYKKLADRNANTEFLRDVRDNNKMLEWEIGKGYNNDEEKEFYMGILTKNLIREGFTLYDNTILPDEDIMVSQGLNDIKSRLESIPRIFITDSDNPALRPIVDITEDRTAEADEGIYDAELIDDFVTLPLGEPTDKFKMHKPKRHHTEEHKQKLRESQIRIDTPELRLKRSLSHIGRKFSNHHLKNLSESKKKYWERIKNTAIYQ